MLPRTRPKPTPADLEKTRTRLEASLAELTAKRTSLARDFLAIDVSESSSRKPDAEREAHLTTAGEAERAGNAHGPVSAGVRELGLVGALSDVADGDARPAFGYTHSQTHAQTACGSQEVGEIGHHEEEMREREDARGGEGVGGRDESLPVQKQQQQQLDEHQTNEEEVREDQPEEQSHTSTSINTFNSANSNAEISSDDRNNCVTAVQKAHAKVSQHIALLHSYNAIKDIGQGLMGLVAEQRGVRVGGVQEEFGVGVDD